MIPNKELYYLALRFYILKMNCLLEYKILIGYKYALIFFDDKN
jgi:hypothetical protein